MGEITAERFANLRRMLDRERNADPNPYTRDDNTAELRMEAVDALPDLLDALEAARAEVERLRVQLAGCATAAQGYGEEVAQDAYGFSASYADVLALRKRMEKAEAELAETKTRASQATELSTRLLGLGADLRRNAHLSNGQWVVSYDLLVALERALEAKP